MELNVFDDVKNASRNLSNELEVNDISKSMNELSGELNEYLKNNELEYVKEQDLKRPIDIDISKGKNEFGDTTILGKITIEKSAAKDLEKIQNKLENAKDKGMSVVKKGLNRVYDLVKDNIIGFAAGKFLKNGNKLLEYGKNILKKGGDILKRKLLSK